MIQAQTNLGFSITSAFKTAINPIAMTKKTLAVSKKATVATGKIVYKASVLPLQYTLIKPTQWLADKATKPIRNRVHTLVNRRALKLAMDKRKSTVPNAAEKAEAKAWAKHKLTYDGPGGIPTPHGKILAMFAGPALYEFGQLGDPYAGQLGVAPAVIAAAVPVLVALANAMISKYAKSGEAPAHPSADAAANAEDPVTPGTVDLQPVQNAVDEASAAGGDASVEETASGGKHRSVGGIKQSHILIGAAVLGGVVLIALVTRKKD